MHTMYSVQTAHLITHLFYYIECHALMPPLTSISGSAFDPLKSKSNIPPLEQKNEET